MTMQSGGPGEDPVAIPRFDAICAGGTVVDQTELRGHVLRIVALPEHAPPPPALPPVEGVSVRTIILVRHPPTPPPPDTCVTAEPEAWGAFAILLGTTPDELAGTEILADAELWLRAFWKSADAANRNEPQQEAAMIRDIAAHPLAPAAAGGSAHHH
jgi:hypothetical protein